MHSDKTLLALQDILENGQYARDFVAGLSLDDFKADRLRFYAVTRALEIISEAARRLPQELRIAIPNCRGAPLWALVTCTATTTTT